MAKQRHRKYSRQSCCSQNYGCSPGRAAAAAAGQHHRTYGKAFGNFVQEYGEEDQPSQPVRDEESGGDGDAVEKCVDDEAEKNGISLVRVDELVFMRFFAEVEVRSDRVLEEVDDQVAEEN